MPPEEDLKKRVGRKLTKKRKFQRAPTMEIPDKFKDGDDVHEDAAACRGQQAQYMNQSVFSMIAAAGSKVDFHSRFDDGSSDSDDDPRPSQPAVPEVDTEDTDKAPDERMHEPQRTSSLSKSMFGKHRRKVSEHKLLRSLPRLGIGSHNEKKSASNSAELPPPEVDMNEDSAKSPTPRDAPVMSRMLEAEAQAQLQSSAISSRQKKDMAAIAEGNEEGQARTTLAIRLMEIFGYDKPEEVISGRVTVELWWNHVDRCQNIPVGCCKVSFYRATCTSLSITYASTLTYRRNPLVPLPVWPLVQQ